MHQILHTLYIDLRILCNRTVRIELRQISITRNYHSKRSKEFIVSQKLNLFTNISYFSLFRYYISFQIYFVPNG